MWKTRAALLMAAALVLPGPVWGDEHPGMDDFYARTRGRHEGFTGCLIGLCDGQRLLQLLVGGQVANPSTDALQPALAEGVRLGADAGLRGGYQVVRARGFADLLWVNATGERITEYVAQATGFFTTAAPGAVGLHGQADVQLAARTELEPDDLAEFVARPYTVLDVEGELAPVGVMVDKEAFLALPLGYAHRVRWDGLDGQEIETRRTLSGALALRAFQKQIRHHYQLEALRVTRLDWAVPAGKAHAWKGQLGYQHLSPDLPGVQLWLLFGWAWVDGLTDDHGFITRVGADVDFRTVEGLPNLPAEASLHFDRDWALDRRDLRFRAVARWRAFLATTAWAAWRVGAGYEWVSVGSQGTLHAFVPEVAWRPFSGLGFEVGLRVRVRARSGPAAETLPDGERLQLNLDWLL
ncbi:MAG: hypothetical protein KC613_00895 [Myxococcales bacterium]|nr:hypothetical protein [Myxococcales bacterium]MCB9523414.1 hypothetical protein [Myxococcales bacterium]